MKIANIKSKKWLKAAAIRAIKTMAQAALASLGTAVMLSDIDWLYTLSVSLFSGVLSVLTSIAGIPEAESADE